MLHLTLAGVAGMMAAAWMLTPEPADAQGRDRCKGPPWERPEGCEGRREPDKKPPKPAERGGRGGADFQRLVLAPGAPCGGYTGEVEEGSAVLVASPAVLVNPNTGERTGFAGMRFVVADLGESTESPEGDDIPGWVQLCTETGGAASQSAEVHVPFALIEVRGGEKDDD